MIVSMLMLGTVAVPVPVIAQKIQRIQKNPAQQQQIKTTMQAMAVDMAKKSGNGWQDINSAPSFPVPLFRGNQTKFFRPNAAAAAYLENSHSHSITILTRDPAASVFQYYEKNLQASGFTLDTKLPRQVGKLAKAFVLRGESPAAFAAISIATKDDPAGPASQITISVINKQAAVKK